MLEPREADVPALFLVLVVLPLVAYILLGKWSEAAKKKDRISQLAQLAAEEALLEEAITTARIVPSRSSSKGGFHECARCFGPATTRCSRCKSVRYCSGKCQIIHWRLVHKEECQKLETTCLNLFPRPDSIEESFQDRDALSENLGTVFSGYDIKQSMQDSALSDKPYHTPITTAAATTTVTSTDMCQDPMLENIFVNKGISGKSTRKVLKREDATLFGSFEEDSNSWVSSPALSSAIPSKEASMRHKFESGNFVASSEKTSTKHGTNPPVFVGGHTAPVSKRETYKLRGETESQFKSTDDSSILTPLYSEKNGRNAFESEMVFTSDNGDFPREGLFSIEETVDLNSCPEKLSLKEGIKANSTLHPQEPKASISPRSLLKGYPFSGSERKGRKANESKVSQLSASSTIPAQGSNGIWDMGVMKKMGLRKLSRLPRQNAVGVTSVGRNRKEVLFPYEEFVKLFHCEVWDIFPRGLLNCGNSCYANVVLQSLMCTKPLVIYLLQRSHSRNCCVTDWCLVCELEQHVMMLREYGGPLSPSGILSHMSNIGCQIGGGSQEDAHEFLRHLVASMQSICLEEQGGEKEVDPRLQETTFIQHTFGGRLRSKVKCLRCQQESERYENIMDLTLEIHGWVESLEDALTQFTASEDLDGENMYRCGRCAKYVKARKQLSVHEAPNILTIVLKRFQSGRYGKINKFVTFPDMLDMIPFMTGTSDSPPLYMLYAVVVHLDKSNESFSGHYVSYVKDLQGTWLKIDDTEVQQVPMSQVMSEGAYILFYSRSCPRPPRACTSKASWLQPPTSAKHWTSKPPRFSRQGQSRPKDLFLTSELSTDPIAANKGISNERFHGRNSLPMRESFAEPMRMSFSDATSSDWSLFTSSDESSFTTESTRDSFSTVDYADAVNIDPFSSIFNTFYAPEYSSPSTVSCERFFHCKAQTRFLSEEKGFVFDSYLSTQPDSVKNPKQVSVSLTEPLPSVNNCGIHVRYGSNPNDSFVQTSGHC